MSRYSNVRIAKNGKLLADKWTFDRKTREGTTEKNIDITSDAMFYLHDECDLEPFVTVKDLLLLVENIGDYKALSPMLTDGPWLRDLVDEGLIGEADDDTSVKTIVMKWVASIQDDYYDKGKSTFESSVDVYGENEGDNETYALSFSPVYNLVDCDIRLDNEFVIKNECSEAIREYRNMMSENFGDHNPTPYCPTALRANKNFTLLDILYGFFWELSFHGGPKNRDSKIAELSKTIERIKSGEEKTYPWEEVRDRLKGEIK